MRPIVGAFLLLVAACGVPSEPGVDELVRLARAGDATAVAGLVGHLGRDTAAEDRARVYRLLLELGPGNAESILGACRDADPVRREHALALAANLKLAGASAAAEVALGDQGFPRRYVAAWALGELGDPAAAPALVAALGSEPENLSRSAARALIKLGRGSVSPLLEALPRLSPQAAAYAVRVLGEIGDPKALTAIVEALETPGLRGDAAWALGKLGRPEAGAVLLSHLADPDWRVRLEVARALGLLELATADAGLDHLRNADPEPPVREWAARSLALLRGTPQTYVNAKGLRVTPDSLYR